MELTMKSHEGLTVAVISGLLDETAREAFREHLHPVVGQSKSRLIIDLKNCQRINSPGIGNLVALTADANTHDSRVVLCNLQTFVAMVIGVTKLDRFFTIADDLEDAVAKCREEPA
jgi:anti-anti-sigma factor